MTSPIPPNPRAYVFDVFGTVVNWRESLAKGLAAAARTAVETSEGSGKITETVVTRVRGMTHTDWQWFANEW
jgi:2-haloacid dehalogenase